MHLYLRLTLLVIVSLGSALVVFAQSTNTTDPLVRVLQTKGILTEAEARAITINASPAEQRNRLAALLRDKGVISATEFESLQPAPVKMTTADYKTSAPEPMPAAPQPTPAPVIAAVAPVRLVGIDAPSEKG